jgi:hypothetical protein
LKAEFENIFGFDKSAINLPVLIEETPIGVIIDVNDKVVTCEIWEKFCGYEFLKTGNSVSLYLSSKEQDSLNR